MTKHNLTTTAAQIVEARDVRRRFLFSAGLFNGCTTVYLRLSDVGDAEVILSKDASSIVSFIIPAKRRVYAWTNTGTAELCELQEVQ